MRPIFNQWLYESFNTFKNTRLFSYFVSLISLLRLFVVTSLEDFRENTWKNWMWQMRGSTISTDQAQQDPPWSSGIPYLTVDDIVYHQIDFRRDTRERGKDALEDFLVEPFIEMESGVCCQSTTMVRQLEKYLVTRQPFRETSSEH